LLWAGCSLRIGCQSRPHCFYPRSIHGTDQRDGVPFSHPQSHAGFACRYLGLRDPGGTLFALYKEHLVGAWRWIYVVTAVASLYLNVFVLVVQSFVKVSTLNALAPTQSEPPFAITQVVVLPQTATPAQRRRAEI
jgi:hypothetical protein